MKKRTAVPSGAAAKRRLRKFIYATFGSSTPRKSRFRGINDTPKPRTGTRILLVTCHRTSSITFDQMKRVMYQSRNYKGLPIPARSSIVAASENAFEGKEA